MEPDRHTPTDQEIDAALKRVNKYLEHEKGLENAHDREELAADIVIVAMEKFDRSRGSFKNWAIKQVRFKILAYYRSKQRPIVARSLTMTDLEGDDGEPFDFADDFETLEAVAERRDLLERLVNEIAKKANGDRMVYYVHAALDDKPPRAIAEDLGVDEDVVYKLQKQVVYHARKLLSIPLKKLAGA